MLPSLQEQAAVQVLARIAELPQGHIDKLLPWNWKAPTEETLAA